MQKSIFFWTLMLCRLKPLLNQGFRFGFCLVNFIAKAELNVLATLIS
ncbi:MAG: hypothetical protein RLZZ60_1299 [Bacteroidota bacterium]|jgi:hypothetical protein